jgi:hypothetical protein
VKHPFRIGERNPALDVVSYGRRGGADRPLHFTREQIAQIARTVHLGRLAADVERFRQSLKVPLTRQERAVTTIRRGRAERPPVQLEFTR